MVTSVYPASLNLPDWKWIALRGVAAIVFGVLALLWPGIALAALVILWGVYALLDGILTLAICFRRGSRPAELWPWVAIGVAGIVFGLIAIIWPDITAVFLLVLIAVWALTVGVLQLLTAIRWRKTLKNEWWLWLSGALSIVFGVLVALNPASGAVALVWLIAFYAILFGITLVFLSLRLRNNRPSGATRIS